MQIRAEKALKTLSGRLHGLRRKRKWLTLLEGLCRFLSFTLVLFAIILIAESLFSFPPPFRTVLVVSGFVLLIAGLIVWVGQPFYVMFVRLKPDDESLSMIVGAQDLTIRDRLANAISVYRDTLSKQSGTSAALAGAALLDVYQELEHVDLHQFADTRSLLKRLRELGLAAAAILMILIPFHASLSAAWTRISHPAEAFAGRRPFAIEVHPGDVTVVEGEDVDIWVSGSGKVPDSMVLRLNGGGSGSWERALQAPYRTTLKSLHESLVYSVEAGGMRSEAYRIEVIQRPMLISLRVRVTPPSYTQMGSTAGEINEGDFEAVWGSRARINVQANKPLSESRMVFEGHAFSMDVDGTRASIGFTVTRSGRYWIELKDAGGLGGIDPVAYSIDMIPDLPPIIRLLYPEASMDLDESMQVDVHAEAEDDFGIDRCILKYAVLQNGDSTSIDPAEGVQLPLSGDDPAHQMIDYRWDLSRLSLFPSELVAYYIEVTDNDVFHPKTVRSRTNILRFPSMTEIFREVQQVQDDQVESLEALYREELALRERFEAVAMDMKAGEAVEWEDRKTIEALSEKQKEISGRVEQMNRALGEMIDELSRHDLMSLEILEKYSELQTLYEQISSPELQQAMERLMREMEKMDRDALNRAMENLQLDQETVLKSIERTLNLLKRLKVEQSAEELVRRSQDLLDRQRSLDSTLNGLDETGMNQAADKQDQIGDEYDALSEDMKRLKEEMQALPQMGVAEIDSAIGLVKESQIQKALSEQEALLRQGKGTEASSEASRIEDTMESVSKMLSRMQKGLLENQKSRVIGKLRRISHQLLSLSSGQETLIRSIENGESQKSSAVKHQLSLASGLNQAADSLFALSRETFSVNQAMGTGVGDAMRAMQQALNAMGQGMGKNVTSNQMRAMGGLNRSVLAIRKAMNAIQSMQSGAGMESFMMQLEQMSGAQMALNRSVADLLNRGALTLEEQAALARMAAEQEAVRKALENLLNSGGQEVAGRLDRLVEEMETVVRELEENRASEATVKRQQRILSRLLDAQNALRADVSRKRKSSVGEDMEVASPGPLPILIPRWQQKLQQDILHMAKEGYTKAYQELIRQYFEALMRQEKQ